MKRMFALLLAALLVCVNGIVFAEEPQLFNHSGISFEIPAGWICEPQNDGSEIFYDMESGTIMTVNSETADGLLFDFGFEMAGPYVESVFPGDNLWSYIGLISRNGIRGCYAAGYAQDLPCGFVFLEKDNSKTVFVLADATDTQNPNRLLDKLLDLFPWMDDSGNVDFRSAEMLSFVSGGYEYKVPENWRHKESADSFERSHTYNDGEIFLNVYWDDSASITSALEMLYRMFPGQQPEMLGGETMGFLMDGECITGMKMIKACIVGYPGYVEITYRHDGSENQREEFNQLLSSFENMM